MRGQSATWKPSRERSWTLPPAREDITGPTPPTTTRSGSLSHGTSRRSTEHDEHQQDPDLRQHDQADAEQAEERRQRAGSRGLAPEARGGRSEERRVGKECRYGWSLDVDDRTDEK